MEQLSFSVITVSYNHAEFIRKTIDSVLAQEYKNFEHIIVDGGSTDGTLEILKEYPHLKWKSEADRGQTHALEKGFRQATGDIIAWINSDDFYEPKVFHAIADAMQDYPVLLTKAARTDRVGTVQEIIPNTPRNYFDLLKFWAPYAWLAQTGVFFKRELLDEVILPNGCYLDEELYYVMDFELWLRLAQKYPFTNYLDKTCAYFRMYEENKTGKEGAATQKECARIYRRHINALVNPERKLSFVILVNGTETNIADTLNSIVGQSLVDTEILLIGYGDQIDKQALRSFVMELDLKLDTSNIRYKISESSCFFTACNFGMEHSAAALVTFIRAGDVLPEDYCLKVHNHAAGLVRGIVYPASNQNETLEQLTVSQGNLKMFAVDALCSMPLFSSCFTAKKACLLDLGGFESKSSLHAVPDLLLRAMNSSWHIEIDSSIQVQETYDYALEKKTFPVLQPYTTAKLINALTEQTNQSPFRKYLAEHHDSTIKFDPSSIETAKHQLAKAPETWQSIHLLNQGELEQLSKDYPEFSPTYYFLFEKHQANSNTQAAAEAKNKFEELRTQEQFAFAKI